MKKLILVFVLILSSSSLTFGQKKANGTVYIEHPAIQVVTEFTQATVAGDKEKMISFLTEDFKYYNGTSAKTNAKGLDTEAFLKNAMRYSDELDYFSMSPYPESYPDAIVYKKDNKKKEIWVQTWDMVKGVHKTTGVKIDAAAHRLYKLTKDNKIKTIINYSNPIVLHEIGSSFADRTNGTIYNHHENINTVRKAMYAFEQLDIDKTLSFYTEDAKFYNINDEYGKSANKEEIKPIWEEFLDQFEITGIDLNGYPDYLEYEMSNGREVLSWWKYHLIRKADKKKISIFMHFSHSFDEDGKIISHVIYYGAGLLKQ